MKYNTLFTTNYPHTANYMSWEPHEEEDGTTIRLFDPAVTINCRIGLNSVGSVTLFSQEQLMDFGVVQEFIDGSSNAAGEGKPFLVDRVYWVTKSAPLINPVGIVYGYYHNLAMPTAEQMTAPLSVRPGLDWVDQAL